MKIIHLYKSYFPDKGGIAQVIRSIVTMLKSKIEFEVLATKKGVAGDKYQLDGITVRRSGSLCEILSMPISPLYIFKIWFNIGKFDVVHYHYPFPLVDLALSMFIPKKCKLIVHWHSDIIKQKLAVKFLTPIIHRTLKRADAIIVTSPIMIKNSPFLPTYSEKCHIIPFGFDIDYWHEISLQERKKISQLKKECPNFILAVGRLVSYKGFEYLIKAMTQTKDINLIIIGKGVLKTALEQQIKKLNLSHRVKILSNISAVELKNFYHACEFFVLPSAWTNEAFGLVQVEAMACQKAIINTDLKSSVPWVARHRKEAITVARKDSQALASAINLLQKDKKLRNTLAENGFIRANKTFSIEKFRKSTLKLYKDII